MVFNVCRSLAPLAGRYRLEVVLGRGAGTTTFRARDEGIGRSVALKLAETASAAEGLLREHEALLALRHPHLPEVHQLGVDASSGRAFLARELVDGEPLDEFARGASESALITILRQLARALAFLHGRGVVHGDVKPANILVRTLPEGGPWSTLIDLGFAADESEAPDEVFRGTPFYSPARILGGAARGTVDDVFALARSFLELRSASDWDARVAALLSGSTAEDPDLRPRDARAFLNALDQAAVSFPDDGFETDPVTFVGRCAELEQLLLFVEDEQAGVVTLEGPAGIGKSALMRALRTRLVGARKRVVHVDCRDAAQDPSDGLLRLLAFTPGVRPAERIATFASVGRDAHGVRVGDSVGERPTSSAEFASALGRMLVLLGRRGGAVVLVDEIQHELLAENGPLPRLLIRLSTGTGISGVTFILALRGSAGGERSGGRARNLHLGELPFEDAADLACAALATRRWRDQARCHDLPELGRRIARAAGGHPGFLEAVAKGLPPKLSAGGAELDDDEALAAHVPSSFTEAIDQRLDALRVDARHVIEALSILRAPATVATLVDLVDLSDTRRRAALDELCREGLVGFADPAEDRSRPATARVHAREGFFVSSRVVASRALERMTAGQAESLHARTVAVLSSRGDQDVEVADAAAHHALASGRAALVAQHVAQSVQSLLARGLPGRAAWVAERALAILEQECSTSGERTGESAASDARRVLQLGLADALLASGELKRALECYERVAALIVEPRDIVHVMRQQAECQVTLGDFEGAERRLAAIEPGVLDAISADERALLAGTRARLASRRGRPAAATRLLHRGLEEWKDTSKNVVAAELMNNLGVVAFETARFGDSEQWHRRALEIRQRIDDVRGVSFSLGNLASIAFVRGLMEEAREGYQRALELKRRLGEPAAIATSLSNLGLVAQGMGSFADALALHEEALQLRDEIGDEAGRARSLEKLAELMRLKGCHGRAARLAERAVQVALGSGERDVGLAAALLTLAGVFTEAGRFDRARTAVEQGLELCIEVGLPSEAALFEARGAELTLLESPGDVEATRRLRAAIKSLREGGDHLALAKALWIRAELALDEGEDLRAAQAAQELSLLGERCQNPAIVAAARYVTGVTLDRGGDSTLASEALHLAREEAERMGLPRLMCCVQAALASLHERGARRERAARWSLRCIETIRAELAEVEGEDEEIAFLAHPRRSGTLKLLANRAGGRFNEPGSRIG